MAQICGLGFLDISDFPWRSCTRALHASPPRIGELGTKKFVFGNLHINDVHRKEKKQRKLFILMSGEDLKFWNKNGSQILTSEKYPHVHVLSTLLLWNSGFPHYKKVTVVLAHCLMYTGTKKKSGRPTFSLRFFDEAGITKLRNPWGRPGVNTVLIIIMS